MSNMKKRTSYGYGVERIPETAPAKLGDHIFFGLELDKDQIRYRDAIWDKNTDIVFCNAPAGTGKTLVAVATSVLMCQWGLADQIVYVMHPVGDPQGFLPGTISEKSSVYFEALYQSLITINEWPEKVIKTTSMTAAKTDGYVTAITDTYLRGSNIGGSFPTILILDECQNYTEFALRKVLTRACIGTKVICIGHDLQCDLHGEASGFLRCMNHFKMKNNPRFKFCELHTSHRSLVAQVADEPWEKLEPVKKTLETGIPHMGSDQNHTLPTGKTLETGIPHMGSDQNHTLPTGKFDPHDGKTAY